MKIMFIILPIQILSSHSYPIFPGQLITFHNSNFLKLVLSLPLIHFKQHRKNPPNRFINIAIVPSLPSLEILNCTRWMRNPPSHLKLFTQSFTSPPLKTPCSNQTLFKVGFFSLICSAPPPLIFYFLPTSIAYVWSC